MPTYCSCTNWRVLRSASEAFGPENAPHIQLLTGDPFPQCSKLYYVLAYRKHSKRFCGLAFCNCDIRQAIQYVF